MDLAKLFEKQEPLPGIIGIERIMFCYCGFTLALSFLFYDQIDSGPGVILYRLLFVGITLLLWQFYKKFPCDATYVIRVFFQIILLSYWYPDVYSIAKLMPNMDPLFAQWDQIVFGCQPAVVFSQMLSGTFWSEFFYMGYFSFYVMIFVTVVWATFVHFRRFDSTTTILLTSFLIYLVLFLFLQAAGPQFYYDKVGMQNVTAGIFPQVGDWFRYHSELVHHNGNTGIFCSLVELMQKSEKPIAAFPSSHVGMATIVLYLSYKMSKRLFRVFIPFYIVLCFSTVYIGAHYAVDIFAGWITAIIILYVTTKIYRSKFIHRPRKFNSMHQVGHHHHHHHHSH